MAKLEAQRLQSPKDLIGNISSGLLQVKVERNTQLQKRSKLRLAPSDK
jgi:hypothetical protein